MKSQDLRVNLVKNKVLVSKKAGKLSIPLRRWPYLEW